MTHPLLARQLRKLELKLDDPPDKEAWIRVLDSVARAYNDADQERYLLERSSQLSTTEMLDLHIELANNTSRLSAILELIDTAVLAFDRDLRLERANSEAARILGVSTEELLSRWSLDDLMEHCPAGTGLRSGLEELARTDGRSPEYRRGDDDILLSNDGHATIVSSGIVAMVEDGALHGVIITARDMSDLRRFEVELRHAQKLEAVGRLAAGIAHEINTPIQFIGDNLRFVSDSFEVFSSALALALFAEGGAEASTEELARLHEAIRREDPAFLRKETQEAIAQSLDGIARVAGIVKAMKSFAHPGSSGFSVVDLNAAIHNTIIVATNELKYVADVTTDFGQLPLVACIGNEINQVILNLLINAAHAVADRWGEQGGRGTILVRTRQHESNVTIEVTDNGVGIDPQTTSHIFEPFFTTKEVGRGTGQGLALAHQVVVEGHNGSISVDSVPGKGATFMVSLPVQPPPDTNGGASSATTNGHNGEPAQRWNDAENGRTR